MGFLEIQEKYLFVDFKDEEVDKEDYIHNGQNDWTAVLNVYRSPTDRMGGQSIVYCAIPKGAICQK